MDSRVQPNAPAETPASLLEQAQQALLIAAREEEEARQKVSALETQEQRICLELKSARSAHVGPKASDFVQAVARKQLEDLSRKRAEVTRRKIHEGEVVRRARERLHEARRTYENLQRRVLELQNTIRREERAVAQWQQHIKDMEQQLARWERMLAEAQVRLEQAKWEQAKLVGPRAIPLTV